ncbi:hypothetical protein F441_19321 [Phytophthora nicotianae CJ01A1]|uniref:RxLR effector protein n=4 Tax=Phytophthora nicotianae TaxID=4792 RepID=W2YBA1_PHYNI|nr:hypothetical protein L915_18919 [Phytophthora nicotianae]ETO62664.1 hypothetical protein F444_19450 [Phytophthora nicotianae P1976]ETP03755.1 hypothetical protein F441_19321 [Phytophthora nicotianae CJ01A1]ETP31908.1 hypothetical protein F442_19272 [Phytophthora nicotianae P10297]ETL27660.1 hypothetical protein L916_18816 [Phytophthora nicotianae]
MRAYFAVLLFVATLVASTGALSTNFDSRRALTISSPGAPQTSVVKENGLPVKRHLRKKESKDDSTEERVTTSQFSSLEKVVDNVQVVERTKKALTKKIASLERLDLLLTTEKVPALLVKRHDSRFWRNVQYNVWIFTKKSPDWVKENYPAFAKGYDLFYHNRMTRGYKYA